MKNCLYILLILLSMKTSAQVVIGTPAGNCDSSAILDIRSNYGGLLIPRMNQNQIDAIKNPADGLMYYNTTTEDFNLFTNKGTLAIDKNGINFNDEILYRKTIEVDNQDDKAYAVAATSDGGCIMGGYARINSNGSNLMDIYFLKLTSTGEQDKNFGTNGIVILRPGGYQKVKSVKQTYNGGYVATGYTTLSPTQFFIVKLTASGTPDAQFGTNGVVTVSKGSNRSYGNDIEQTADSGFIVVGTEYETNGSNIFITKLTKNGSLDTYFNGTGALCIGDNNKYEYGRSVAVSNNGDYFITGYISGGNNGGEDAVVMKLNSDGSYNTGFNGGKFVYGSGAYERGYAILAKSNSGCSVLGYKTGVLFVTDFDNTGSLLHSKIYSNSDYGLKGYDMEKVGDSAYIIAGFADAKANDSTYGFLMKIDTALNLVSSFGHNGILLFGDKFNNEMNAVCMTNDNGFVTVGFTNEENQEEDMYLVKVNSSGRSCEPTLGITISTNTFGQTNTYFPNTSSQVSVSYFTPQISAQGTVTTICH